MPETLVAVLAIALVVSVAFGAAVWRQRRRRGPQPRPAQRREPYAWLLVAIVAIWVPVTAVIGYLATRSADNPPGRAAVAKERKARPGDVRPSTDAVDDLSARVRDEPADAAGWAALGRQLAARGRFAEAASALGEAARLKPGDPSVLADRADVLAMANGRRFEGEPDRLVHEALAADPRHVKALALAGTSAYARGDHAAAARHWRRLLAIVPPTTEAAREVEAMLREAERRVAAGGGSARVEAPQ